MMWSESSGLTEIQAILEKIFEKKMRLYTRVCDIIELSFDEYTTLTNKINAISTMEAVNRYSLSILTAWVTSYKFNREDECYKIIKDFMANMPQHYTKFTLESLNNTCYDYQIYNFKSGLNNIESIQQLIKIHAGLAAFT